MTRGAHIRGGLAVIVSVAVLMAPAAANGAFPGQNGRIAFDDSNGSLWTMKADGSDGALLLASPPSRSTPAWSADGTRVAYSVHTPFSAQTRGNDDLFVVNADGSGEMPVTSTPNPSRERQPSWSPDGTRIAYTLTTGATFPGNIATVPATGGPSMQLTSDGLSMDPSWSPDGTRIAFAWYVFTQDGASLGQDIWVINPDGTNAANVTNDPTGNEFEPDWSPDGSRIVFTRTDFADGECCGTYADWHIDAIDADGTDRAVVVDTPDVPDVAPRWSPDGTKILYSQMSNNAPGDMYVINADGTGEPSFVGGSGRHSWQPIPITAYPRPKGATPTQVSMVPAYAQCTAPNRTHGPPLGFPSCSSPSQTSDELTVGTADSNGKATKSRGSVRYDTVVGNPATSADEADVQVTVELSDVYRQGTLADYTGELRAQTSLRITDKLNTPAPGGPGAATVSDAFLGATVPCTATADTSEGASCNLVTTFDSLVPGTITETKRSIWALGAAQLYDGGADSDGDTPADNTLFMTQGIFIP